MQRQTCVQVYVFFVILILILVYIDEFMCRRMRRYDSASQEMLQVLQKCMECQGDNGRAFWQAPVARISAGIWARPRHIGQGAYWAHPCPHLRRDWADPFHDVCDGTE